MLKQAHNFYEFGSFRLDPEERLLLRHGQPVELSPKAFDTLLVLVRQSGHLVRKEDLIRSVWPATAVEEGNLTLAIHQLRKVLTNGDGEKFIETVPRHGYRFTANVLVGTEEGKTGSTAPEQKAATPRDQERPRTQFRSKVWAATLLV